MDADGRIVGVHAFIAFPLSPLTALRAIAYEETTDRGVWGTGRRIKVERDLDPNIARTGNIRVWRLGRVELKPAQLELLGVLGGGPCAVRTALWKRCEHGGALYG
jgi:hypothetical protein